MKTLMGEFLLALVWILVPMLIDLRAGIVAIAVAILCDSMLT